MKMKMGFMHGHRFHLSSMLPRCQWACLQRRYADSDAGSDIQQDSLLDNTHEDNGCHDNTNIDSLFGNQTGLHDNQLPILTVHTAELVSIDTNEDLLLNRQIVDRNTSVANGNHPFSASTSFSSGDNHQSHSQTDSLNQQQVSVNSNNQNMGHHTSDLLVQWETNENNGNYSNNQTASNHGSLSSSSEFTINSDLEDLFTDSLPWNRTGVPSTSADPSLNHQPQPGTSQNTLSNVLFSLDRQVLTTRNFNQWRWHEMYNRNGEDTSDAPQQQDVQTDRTRNGAFRPIMRHYCNMNSLQERIRLENVFQHPQNLQNNSSTNSSNTNSVSSNVHTPVSIVPGSVNEAPSEPCITTLPIHTATDTPHRSLSNGSNRSGHLQQQNWYIYDPRLVPQGRTSRMTAETNCGGLRTMWNMPGIISPPAYDDIDSSSNQVIVVNSQRPDNLGQGFPDDPPPPYVSDLPDEAPPAYETSFHHTFGHFSSLFSDDFADLPLPYELMERGDNQTDEDNTEDEMSDINSGTNSSCLSDGESNIEDEDGERDGDGEEEGDTEEQQTEIMEEITHETIHLYDHNDAVDATSFNTATQVQNNQVTDMADFDLEDDLDPSNVNDGQHQGQPDMSDTFAIGQYPPLFMRQRTPLRWSRNMHPNRWASSQLWI